MGKQQQLGVILHFLFIFQTVKMSFEALKKKYEVLKKSWSNGKLDEVGIQLDSLKLALTEISFLPTDEGEKADAKDLFVAREVLEIGAEYSVAVEDVDAFERYMAMLKTYYMDYAYKLEESPKKFELLGLNLLRLLSQNETAKFHTELELLDPSIIQENPYISCPVKLEQDIMEGSYKKVIEFTYNVPAKTYNFFMSILLITIREEIAKSMEAAYEEMSAKECEKMLNLERPVEVKQFFAKKGWVVDNRKMIRFQDLANDEKKIQVQDMDVPSKELAQMAIRYAREMEQIV